MLTFVFSGNDNNPNRALDQFFTREVPYLKYFAMTQAGVKACIIDKTSQEARLLLRGADSRPLTMILLLQLLCTIFKEDINTLIVMKPVSILFFHIIIFDWKSMHMRLYFKSMASHKLISSVKHENTPNFLISTGNYQHSLFWLQNG